MLMNQIRNPYYQQAFAPNLQSSWNGWTNYGARFNPMSNAFSYNNNLTNVGGNWNGIQSFNPVSQAFSYRFHPGTGSFASTQPVAGNVVSPMMTGNIPGNVPFTQSFTSGYNTGTGAANFNRQSFGISEPRVDISETKNDIVLACDLPNVNLNDLNLTVSENSCAISAQSWINGQNIALHRTVPLPTLVRAEAVDTNYSNGILQIRLPKKDISSRRDIKVNMSQ